MVVVVGISRYAKAKNSPSRSIIAVPFLIFKTHLDREKKATKLTNLFFSVCFRYDPKDPLITAVDVTVVVSAGTRQS